MTVSENYLNIYRTPDNIILQIKDVIDSFLSFLHSKLNLQENLVIDKLKTLELYITPQIMHTFKAPLDQHDFKDLVKQLIDQIMDELIERAYVTGIITKTESNQIRRAIDESKELEFCAGYHVKFLK